MRFPHLLAGTLGLLMVVFGLNKYFGYLEDFSLRPAAQAFWDGLANSGYFFEWLGAVEALAGVLLLIPRTRIIGALVLFPIALNILVFHLFLAPEAIVFGLAVFLLNLVVLWEGRKALLPLVQ